MLLLTHSTPFGIEVTSGTFGVWAKSIAIPQAYPQLLQVRAAAHYCSGLKQSWFLEGMPLTGKHKGKSGAVGERLTCGLFARKWCCALQ